MTSRESETIDTVSIPRTQHAQHARPCEYSCERVVSKVRIFGTQEGAKPRVRARTSDNALSAAMSATPANATRMIQVVESLMQLSNRVPMRSHQRKLRNFAMAIYKQQKHERTPKKLDALCDMSQKRIDEVYQRWGVHRLGPKPIVSASRESAPPEA